MKQLYIFDMDGLTLDTERLNQDCWVKVFKDMGIPYTEEQLASIVGMGFQEAQIFFPMLTHGKYNYTDLRPYRDAYQRERIEQSGVPVKAGVKAYLEQIRALGYLSALLTSTFEIKARELLAKAGLDHAYDFMIFGDHVHNPKPDPEIYERLEKLTTIPKDQWIVFEDSYNGVKAANNAGVDVIWVKDLADLKGRDVQYIKTYDSFLDVPLVISKEVF